jgi:CDGSH-type Zn-finger protein
VVPGGPLLIEGPVELVTDDGQTLTSDRFLVAVCVCRRSRRYPFCDTSHRRRVRQEPPEDPEGAVRDQPGPECSGSGQRSDVVPLFHAVS